MYPKNNFFNSRPSTVVNSEPERADDLATTDDELESGGNKTLPDETLKDGEFVNRVNDAEEPESLSDLPDKEDEDSDEDENHYNDSVEKN